MDINTLTETLALALADDSAISSWATANYGRGIQVYVNIDTDNPPGRAECPWVMLYPTGKSVSLERDLKPHNYQIEIGVYDEDMVIPKTRENLTEFVGGRRLEELRQLVQTAITTALPAALDLENTEIDYVTISAFPFFLSGMVIKLTEPVCIGGDYLS